MDRTDCSRGTFDAHGPNNPLPIMAETVAYDGGKRIKALPHVRRLHAEVDLQWLGQAQHGRCSSTDNTAASVVGQKPAWTRTRQRTACKFDTGLGRIHR
jgi:hypothetical protein